MRKIQTAEKVPCVCCGEVVPAYELDDDGLCSDCYDWLLAEREESA